MRRLYAQAITERAQRWLRQATAVRVLHVFAEVCNLVDQQSRVLSLVSAQIGPGPFSLPLSPPVSFWQYVDGKTAVAHTPNTIQLDTLTIDLTMARHWPSRPSWDTCWSTRAIWLPLLRQTLQSESEQTLTERAAERAEQALLAALDRRNWDQAATAVHRLAGLGEGLTPAGDDFLIGTLFGMQAAGDEAGSQRLSALVREVAVPRTTTLSANWLRAAAAGEAWNAWHQLVADLAACDSKGETAVFKTALRILQTGHSSGRAALRGFTAVAQLIAH